MTMPSKDHMLSNKTYDVLKFIAQILLPAVGTLYFALASIWGLPAGQETVGTITAVDTFLGVLLGVSTTSYNKSEAKYDGEIEVEAKPNGKKLFSLVLAANPDDLETKKDVIFKISSK